MNIFLYSAIILVVVGTFIPLMDAEHWTIRGQEYIKPFYLLTSILLLFLIPIGQLSIWYDWLVLIILIFSIIYSFQKFLPLTFLFPIQLPSIKQSNPDRQIKILVYNVYQYNKEYQKLIDLINLENPHIVFLLETDEKWDNALKEIYPKFPHKLKAIRNDTYGLIMMTNLDVTDSDVNHIVTENIPSMELVFSFHEKKIKIYGLHPKPPIIGESLYSSKKDEEFMKIAEKINYSSNNLAHLVIGDFNEVSWGRTFKKFWKKAQLKDPRRGRFFKPSFPSYSPLKIPLDHALCSDDFELVEFDIKENIGSDHLPLIAVFQLS